MKLQLNFNKPDNYSFFCPVSKVHLTRSNPVATVNEVTPYISRGLTSKAIIEVTEEAVQKNEKKQTQNQQVIQDQIESTPLELENEETVKEPVESVENNSTDKISEQAPTEEPSKTRKGRKGSMK